MIYEGKNERKSEMSLPVMHNSMLDNITTKSAIQYTRKKSFDNG